MYACCKFSFKAKLINYVHEFSSSANRNITYYDFKALNNTKQLASSNSKNPPHIRYYRPSVISNVSIGNNK